MSAVLAIDDLTTGYLRAPVLRDLTITVGDEIVAVLGANGAGKTTLLRAISGTLKVWSGAVSFDGNDIAKRSSWARVRLGIAHVPEGRHVFGAMSVADNLAVAGIGNRGFSGLRPLAEPPSAALSSERSQSSSARPSPFTHDDVYELFPRLGERRQQLAGSLSGGEQQMLVIGRALMTGPRVLLVDEMSAGLAPVTARLLVESLREIHRRGVAMLLVEQSPHLIADAVDRAVGADALAERYLASR